MSRSKTVYGAKGVVAIFQEGELIWRREEKISNKMSDLPSPMIMRDIEPYKNMIDGRIITSRSAHRELLKQHNCVEIGNDMSHLAPKKAAPKQERKKLLHSMLSDVSDRQMQDMVKKEIKNRRNR